MLLIYTPHLEQGHEIHLAMNKHVSPPHFLCMFSYLTIVSSHSWSFINFNEADSMMKMGLFWSGFSLHKAKTNRPAAILQTQLPPYKLEEWFISTDSLIRITKQSNPAEMNQHTVERSRRSKLIRKQFGLIWSLPENKKLNLDLMICVNIPYCT